MDYLKKSSRIPGIKDETKLSASPTESAAFFTDPTISASDNSSNFVTECFFLTISYLHYGFLKSARTFTDISKELHEMKNLIERIESQRPQWAGNPASANLAEQKLKDIRASHCSACLIYDREFVECLGEISKVAGG